MVRAKKCDVEAALTTTRLPFCIIGLVVAYAGRTDAEKVHDWIARQPAVDLDTDLMESGWIACCTAPGNHIARVRHVRFGGIGHLYFRKIGRDTYITYHDTLGGRPSSHMHSATIIAEWARDHLLESTLQRQIGPALLAW